MGTFRLYFDVRGEVWVLAHACNLPHCYHQVSIHYVGACRMCLMLTINESAGSIPGRIIPGAVADKLGYFNVMTVVSILTGICVLCLWIPFNYHASHTGIIVFAVAYGLCSGAYISLMMPCAAKSGSLETLGQRFGTFQSVIAIA